MVLGFVFSPDLKLVTLLLKDHGPAVVKGKWNAPGGKCESDERPADAVCREVWEEAGLYIAARDWTPVTALDGDGWHLDVFAAKTPDVVWARTLESERVDVFSVGYVFAHDTLDGKPLVGNLHDLLAKAASRLTDKPTVHAEVAR
jgi:8-oxo-dGTP pyrophosphatase MutT (NUDIX family)